MKLVIKGIGLRKVGAVLKRERLIKKSHPKGDFIHLWYLGVAPNFQGQGIGEILVKEV